MVEDPAVGKVAVAADDAVLDAVKAEAENSANNRKNNKQYTTHMLLQAEAWHPTI